MAPKQLTLATEVDAGFALHRKATRRDVFLAEMDQVVPWSALCALIEPHYPKEITCFHQASSFTSPKSKGASALPFEAYQNWSHHEQYLSQTTKKDAPKSVLSFVKLPVTYGM